MAPTKNELKIDGFDSRGTAEYPFGYIDFTDGTRIGYAPGTRGADVDGLFAAQQPYLTQRTGREPGAAHYTLAREWARKVNAKLSEAGL